MEDTTTTAVVNDDVVSQFIALKNFLRPQAEKTLLYYSVVQGNDDYAFYRWEKEALDLKAKSREVNQLVHAFSEDPTQTVLTLPPLSAELRSVVYMAAKRYALFTHADGEGESKTLNVYKEERVDDYTQDVLRFIQDETRNELSFPPSLTSKERANVHELAKIHQLHSISLGEGSKRYIMISKYKKKLTLEDLNSRCRKIFLTLTKFPIPTVESPFFEYFIQLYQPLFKSKDKFSEFLEAVEAAGGDSDLSQHYENFKEDLKNLIRSTSAYKVWVGTGLETINKRYHVPPQAVKRFKRTKPIWNPDNHGNHFLSMDLRAANFNCLRLHDPALVLGCATWEELASKASPYKAIQSSKFLRQLILGSLGGKKQIPMWQWVTYRIYARLVEFGICRDEDLVTYGSDELIWKIDIPNMEKEKESDEEEEAFKVTKETFLKVIRFLSTDAEMQTIFGFVKVEPFRLIRLGNTNFYAKEIFSELSSSLLLSLEQEKDKEQLLSLSRKTSPVLKCANADEFAQCYKYYMREAITEYDTITSIGQHKTIHF